ncbi:MAG: CDP-diacylglycerol--serine O-phosphatidyltransferase [Alphaproteobacteria bacterium]|nr:CDP-diacylglycerol--serine O-phosphatidyltransferase [Alphaproteobacteria bacterium]MDX5369703.1 CDP-diacylglycerol--serine O-phosphatidyltransferase [Alphaproteobacteria bacterium]MDX5464338.1 CDP-diacylglycerol--serine O-phosphatidyltransferase [Alphaproteobacteria bacterium]
MTGLGGPRLRGRLSLRSLAPNILTVLGLAAGLSSIRLGHEGRFEAAATMIVLAAIFDGLDGRVARWLKGTSKFGAELDSLADFVSFGVAPGVVIYAWTLGDLGGIGWIVALGYAICCALRLARFNVMSAEGTKPPWANDFFVGVPAPAGAGLALLPMFLAHFGLDWITGAPALIAVYMGGVAALMVSRVPTWSFKRMAFPRDQAVLILLVVGLFGAVLVIYPWATLSMLGIAYLVSIPLSWRAFRDRWHTTPPEPPTDLR